MVTSQNQDVDLNEDRIVIAPNAAKRFPAFIMPQKSLLLEHQASKLTEQEKKVECGFFPERKKLKLG